jgi:hypothetical protein
MKENNEGLNKTKRRKRIKKQLKEWKPKLNKKNKWNKILRDKIARTNKSKKVQKRAIKKNKD